MRRILSIAFVTGLCVVPSVVARAQAQAPPPTEQTAAPPAAATAPAAGEESAHSLFEPTWHEFLFGGRFSSVEGDPARFQRYQDLRDGLLFTGARYAFEQPQGEWSFRGLADNVGWRDQRYFADYERTGRFVVSGTWD